MVLEVREVSRKTPRDGRLEVSEATARRLAILPTPLPVEVGTQRGTATLEALDCTCDKGSGAGGGAGHRHHFVQSPLFLQLAVGETVVVELLDNARLSVARPMAPGMAP